MVILTINVVNQASSSVWAVALMAKQAIYTMVAVTLKVLTQASMGMVVLTRRTVKLASNTVVVVTTREY